MVFRTDPQAIQAWLAVLQARSVVADRLEARLEHEAGLSLASFEVLLHLAGAPDGRLRMNDLARGLVVSKSGVTRLVDRMEAAGLVERVACASDRRVTYAAVTETGRTALARALPVHEDALEEAFVRYLEREEMAQLSASLRKVIAGHGNPQTPCITSVSGDLEPARRKSRR